MKMTEIKRLVREEVRRAIGRKLTEGKEMGTYDYYAHVADDLRGELPEWFESNDINDFANLEELSDNMVEYFMAKGSVTGDMIGFYTSKRDSEEYVRHNMELFREAVEYFGLDYSECVESGAQACDVLIRWYVLEQVASDVIREYVRKRYPGFGR